jgi:hypothetical protein
MGGHHGALDVELDDPGLAWSLRAAAHAVIIGDVNKDRPT